MSEDPAPYGSRPAPEPPRRRRPSPESSWFLRVVLALFLASLAVLLYKIVERAG